MERKKEELIALPPVRGKQIFLAFSVYILANGVSVYLWPQIWGKIIYYQNWVFKLQPSQNFPLYTIFPEVKKYSFWDTTIT